MTAYLLDHRNPHGDHFYETRRSPILGICVHITAGLEDLDATDDHSAERTAAYAASTERSVSWHYGTDTDSEIVLLPDGYTAFHVRGYNSCLLGHEICKRHTDWRNMPKSWRDPTLRQAAKADARRCKLHGIPIRKASPAELDHAIATGGGPVGLIGHTELDPSRRSDPGVVSGVGDTFPWHEYLDLVRFYATGTTPTSPSQEDPEMHEAVVALKNAYSVFLLRNPNVGELAGWLSDVREKDNLDGVVHWIATSPEARKKADKPSGDLIA